MVFQEVVVVYLLEPRKLSFRSFSVPRRDQRNVCKNAPLTPRVWLGVDSFAGTRPGLTVKSLSLLRIQFATAPAPVLRPRNHASAGTTP